MKRIISIIIMFMTIVAIMMAEEKPKLAVYGIISHQLDQSKTNVMCNIVEGYFFEKNEFIIVERTYLNKIIEEQKLTMTGAVDVTRAAEIGKLAGADLIVMVYIDELNGSYYVTIKILDVNSSHLVFIKTEKITNIYAVETTLQNMVKSIEVVVENNAENKREIKIIAKEAEKPQPKPVKIRAVDRRMSIGVSPMHYFYKSYNVYVEIPYNRNNSLEIKMLHQEILFGPEHVYFRGKGDSGGVTKISLRNKLYINKYYDGLYIGPEIGYVNQDSKFDAISVGAVLGYKFSIAKDFALDISLSASYLISNETEKAGETGSFELGKVSYKF